MCSEAGDDENEDGLPDSRPDLASIAFQSAAEETGAGVLEFFEMMFARESPLGLEFDPDEASFDQAAIDDLSRLQARVGALAGNAPFLRLDGANRHERPALASITACRSTWMVSDWHSRVPAMLEYALIPARW